LKLLKTCSYKFFSISCKEFIIFMICAFGAKDEGDATDFFFKVDEFELNFPAGEVLDVSEKEGQNLDFCLAFLLIGEKLFVLPTGFIKLQGDSVHSGRIEELMTVPLLSLFFLVFLTP